MSSCGCRGRGLAGCVWTGVGAAIEVVQKELEVVVGGRMPRASLNLGSGGAGMGTWKG